MLLKRQPVFMMKRLDTKRHCFSQIYKFPAIPVKNLVGFFHETQQTKPIVCLRTPSQLSFEVRCFHTRWQALKSCPCAQAARHVQARQGRRGKDSRCTHACMHTHGTCGPMGWVGSSFPYMNQSAPWSHTQKPAPCGFSISVCRAELQSLLERSRGNTCDLRVGRIAEIEMQKSKRKDVNKPEQVELCKTYIKKALFRSCRLEDISCVCEMYKGVILEHIQEL